MNKTKVLIVDDSVVVRRLLTKVLSEDPALEVVGVAAHGRIALTKIPQVNPDLVILDVEMPEMGGLETLAEIRKLYPRLPVIMFSALTEHGAAVTLEALSLGASDYLIKPSSAGSSEAAIGHIRAELIPNIKAHCGGIDLTEQHAADLWSLPMGHASPVRPSREGQRVDIVAIGVSTGGPNALSVLLSQLSKSFPVPIVIVQHMPAVFTQHLAVRLASLSACSVAEGTAGKVLLPGQVWLAPGGFHMVLKRVGTAVQIALSQDPPENSCRPAVDVLFRSVADVYGPHALAVVMTGMGQDGLRGCQCIRESGGQVLVQDKASSVVWGMPGLVAKAGIADEVVPLNQLAEKISRRVSGGRRIFTESFLPDRLQNT